MQTVVGKCLMPERSPQPAGAPAPSVTRWQAVVLRADIVEFTSITDAAVADGLIGAERLAAVIDGCLGRLTQIIADHGGQISTIAGDAVVAVWPLEDGSNVKRSALSAIYAADVGHSESRNWQFDVGRIRLRSSIACGKLDHFCVVGGDGQRYDITSGPALAEAVAAGRSALPGEIVVSPEVWRQVGDRCRGVTGPTGTITVTRVLQQSAESPLQRDRGGSPALSGLAPLPIAAESIRAPSGGGEFRQVTVIFSQLRHPFYAQPEDALKQLQAATERIQDIVRQLEGSIYQVTADENVTTAVVVFGLSPWSHEDDATRSVEAALKLHQLGSELNVTTSSGIATGKVYCTTYVHGNARIPAIVGPAMNLAARLMQIGEGVVCAETTAMAARRHHRFQLRELAPRALKGKATPVTAYVPITGEGRGLPDREKGQLVGRDAELRALDEAVTQLDEGRGGVCLIEGDAGLGKSALVAAVVRAAARRGILCLLGHADPTERQVAYGVWRGVYQRLLGRANAETPRSDHWTPASTHAALDDDTAMAPLLNAVLAANLGDTLETSRLIGEARFAATRDLLVRCMARAARHGALIVIIEDLHWIDTSSFTLLTELAEAMLPLLIIATGRPAETADPLRQRLLNAPNFTHHALVALTEHQTGEMLAHWLGAQSCEPATAVLMHRRTAGNPLFIEETAPFLRDRGILSITDGCVSVSMPAELANAEIDALLVPWGAPAALESVVLAKYDRLMTTAQIVLRAASVMGSACKLDHVRMILPDVNEDTLTKAVNNLVAAGFLVTAEDSSLAFKHVLLRDVIYNSISFADRRRYHEAIAKWIEGATERAAEWDDAVIAHHCRRAEHFESAIKYLMRAGEQALHGYANPEAAKLFADAFEIDRVVAASTPTGEKAHSRLRAAQIELGLAKASLGLSRYADTKRHSEHGLALLGFPVPAGILRPVPAIFGQVVAQATHHFLTTRSPVRNAHDRAAASVAATALEGLTEAYFFRGEGTLAVYAALRTLNLAERWMLLPQQARGYATLAGITSLSPLRAVAAHYRARALETLKGLDDPAAAVWVYIVVGLSLCGVGEWDEATTILTQAATVAESIGDRRRWRDGIENVSAIAACRGNWARALDGATSMRASATRDKDQRYEVLALREQGFYLLHLGRRAEAETRVHSIDVELRRGVTAEEGATRQDLHALSGTLALERQDLVLARASADAAHDEIKRASVATSFPFTYWSCFLVARIYLNLFVATKRLDGQPGRDLVIRVAQSCRALASQARIYPIAAPAALLCQGTSEWLTGSPRRALRTWKLSRERAKRLHMPYELALAEDQLARANKVLPSASPVGLPLIAEALQ
jgi:class 3 adenylate cyclase